MCGRLLMDIWCCTKLAPGGGIRREGADIALDKRATTAWRAAGKV